MSISYDKKYAFIVEIDGFARAAFKTCGELAIEFGESSIREGGKMIPHKEPALASIPDITLTRGKSNDKDFRDWTKEVCDMVAGVGGTPGDEYLKNGAIVQLDRDGSEKRRYPFYKAWPKRRSVGDWDNDSEEFQIESMTLSIGYWEEV